ncbi:unnamed protein product [Tilletia controversa]|uniref:Uncharacterized protein n=3 Tax=Tilletia TaxID=13289 RepID=A0A8X7MW30_9BASI|nr:hypothetical protein CF336_g2232 [Tilletia laevis]KAE8200028.1 hypothetical protein CF328_g3074 [Tilletia controversa]KAE8262572.1 hypothetical protein A4X03_0g2347 [Tilletia caries]KAE8205760.1 hypothetical protein CF335_g2191 [Tilletia laevis]KAE8252309.1 hypothetical protein A4X06_0g2282 [Tilletia controversa]
MYPLLQHSIRKGQDGPHMAHSAPPAPAGILPPGRFRKLSFSDNHPIVPSPLHTECLKADEPVPVSLSTATKKKQLTQLVQPGPAHPVVNVIDDEGDPDAVTPTNSIIRSRSESNMTSSSAASTSSSANTSGAGSNHGSNPNLLGATPSSSSSSSTTNLTRSSSGRRLSCPTKAKVKLRPCFRRRSSVQTPSLSGAALSPSFSDCETNLDHPPRGRSVRFSPGPPQEVRTHSPVEYDRKSCAVNHRLTAEDVEEMRKMEMGLGLLEAKWAAVAACKAAAAADAAATFRNTVPSSSTDSHFGSTESEECGEGQGGEEAEEAEIKFHSAAGVSGMRRSERHLDRARDGGRDRRWDWSDTAGGGGGGSDSGSGPPTFGASATTGQRGGINRTNSAGSSDRHRLVPPSTGSVARKGMLSRTSWSSVYNRADYSDSSESEYEGTRLSYGTRPWSSSSSSSAHSSPASSHTSAISAYRASAKGNTDAPTASERGHGQGGGNGAGAAALAGWQPPDRCWNGYSGAAGWNGGGMLGRRSTTPVNGVSGAASNPVLPSSPAGTSASLSGYDSPVSEFCYESGSEYDLIG